MGHFFYHYEVPLHAVILETLFLSLRFTAQQVQGEVLSHTFFFSSWSASPSTFAPPGSLGIHPHTIESATSGTGRK